MIEDIVIQNEKFVALVVYSFENFEVCKSFVANIKNVISECASIIRFETIQAPLIRPNLSIFEGG